MLYNTDNLRITGIKEVISPAELHAELPLSELASKTVFHGRNIAQQIIHQQDDRLLIIVGPCSIHDPIAAREYAERLKSINEELKDNLHIVMRVYFEKPRSVMGWKGLINDPYLDGSFKINDGLHIARKLLLDIAEMGIPSGTEYLDLMTPQYISDVVTWGAIGARTTESQVHRQLASGLSCPVGFKNATDGTLKTAIDACNSSSQPHHFIGQTKEANTAIFSTTGNPDCHIILRGGKQPNYDVASINLTADKLTESGLLASIMVDCSHSNSGKSHIQQESVCRELATQIANGDNRIVGLMLESHLIAGNQDIEANKPLTYGQSVTDACMAWDNTEILLRELAEAVTKRRQCLTT